MDPSAVARIIFGACGLALAAALVRHWLRTFFNLRILVRGGRVSVAGRVGELRRAAIEDFVREHLSGVRRAWVLGRWDRRRLLLRGFGLTRPQAQRLRNFLLSEL
jgi:hypothetical protein